MAIKVMADEAVDQQAEEKKQAEPEGGRSLPVKLIMVAVIIVIVLVGGAVGLTMYLVGGDPAMAQAMTDDNEEVKAKPEKKMKPVKEVKEMEPPNYAPIDPKFVVSFDDQKYARFMQFSLDIMSRDKNVIKSMEEHMPVVRSSLVLLFSDLDHDTMITREGKENLLNEITNDINNSLRSLNEDTGIEAAYFSTFVIQ